MNAFLFALLGSALILSSSPVIAAEDVPATLTPKSKWIVNYADDMCTIERSFGSLDDPLQFGIEADPMGFGGRVIIVTKASGRSEFKDRQIDVMFDPGVAVTPGKAWATRVGNEDHLKMSFSLDRSDFTRLATAHQMTIAKAERPPVTLMLPSLGTALAALEECRTDLVKGWGMSAADQKRMAKAAVPDGGSIISRFTSDDYPSAALSQNQQGKVRVRISVDVTGAISNCAVTHSSGAPSLDATTCSVIRQRAHYRPALDDRGQPMASIDVTEVTWLIPTS